MANRVTGTEVKAIIDTDLTSDEVAPFITAANLLVTDQLSDSDELSDDQLKEIERWLSAHFIAIRDPRERIVKAGEGGATFLIGKEGVGLEATPYGQQAMVLDVTGILATIGKRRASMVAVDLDL